MSDTAPAKTALLKSSGAELPATGRARRRTPPWPIWLWTVLSVVAIILLRRFADIDGATCNIATLVVAAVAALVLLVWFALGSGYSRSLRFGVPAVLIANMALAALLLKIESLDASLVPRFRWRWQPPADRLLPPARPAATQPQVDLSATTDHDFPQFLGPHRDATIPGVELERDWQAHPPVALWRQPIGAGWSAFALVGDYAVTLEQRGPDELVTCYAIATGQLAWVQATATRHETKPGGVGPRSTPAIHQGKVYALGATGRLHCLDGATGEVLWEKNLLTEFGIASPEADLDSIPWGRAGSPLIVDDLVVVPAGGPSGGPFVSLVAYDLQSGREVWRGGQTQVSYSSPSLITLGGVPTIVSVNQSNITGHDPLTGTVWWEESWPGYTDSSANNSQAVPLDDHRLFTSKGYGGGAKLFSVTADPGSSPPVWRTADLWAIPKNMQTKLTNVVRHDGYIYGLSEGILECIDESTGARRWKARNGHYGHGQILLVGDTIVVLTETGELVLVATNPDRFEELARIEALEGKTWSNLAFSTPYLVIRNAEEAACYRLPLRGESAADRQPADSR